MPRIPYGGSVHDQREIDAVTRVLQGGPTALRIGPNVAAFEQAVAALFAKRRGVMCNSGSSALYLAVELLGLAPGEEVLTSPLTFSTDLAPLVRAGLVPVFVDVEPDTFNVDASRLEEMVGPRTRAVLLPDLIGNAPDWDVVRQVADRHGLAVVEDSCDALGSTLGGTPTGTRSDISVTSFALSHIITAAGNGGMVCLDDEALADRCLLLRRWGRRSEVQLFGSRQGDRHFFSEVDGMEYDNLFIFDEVGWNFEPSELGAAFGLVQLEKLPHNLARRRHNFDRLRAHLARYPEHFELPRTRPGLETAWHMFPFLVRPESGLRRGDLQRHLEADGIDTRMVWTGNALRQPAFAGMAHRQPPDGLPQADRVMACGLVVPSHHGLGEADLDHLCASFDAFVSSMVAS